MRDLPRLPLRPLSSLSLMLFAAVAHAQTDAPGASGTPANASAPLAPIFVTANPLGDTELIAPTVQLSGDALTRRQADSLGETLNGLPGVSTTTYGPMVGRPIILSLIHI